MGHQVTDDESGEIKLIEITLIYDDRFERTENFNSFSPWVQVLKPKLQQDTTFNGPLLILCERWTHQWVNLQLNTIRPTLKHWNQILHGLKRHFWRSPVQLYINDPIILCLMCFFPHKNLREEGEYFLGHKIHCRTQDVSSYSSPFSVWLD